MYGINFFLILDYAILRENGTQLFYCNDNKNDDKQTFERHLIHNLQVVQKLLWIHLLHHPLLLSGPNVLQLSLEPFCMS